MLRHIEVLIHVRQCVYKPGINRDIKQQIEACPTYQRHWPQEPRQPLKPAPPPERPWQQQGADFMTFDRSEFLVTVNYYSKMSVVQKVHILQCNSAKMITVLKELFAKHWIPGMIWSDSRPQFASHLFAEFMGWNFKHSTSSLRNPGAMGKQNLQSRLLKTCLLMPRALGRTPTSFC